MLTQLAKGLRSAPERAADIAQDLQIRTRVLNDTLADDYRRWCPHVTHTTDQVHLAA